MTHSIRHQFLTIPLSAAMLGSFGMVIGIALAATISIPVLISAIALAAGSTILFLYQGSPRHIYTLIVIGVSLAMGALRFEQEIQKYDQQARICEQFSHIRGVITAIEPIEQRFAHYRVTMHITHGYNKQYKIWEQANLFVQVHTRHATDALIGDTIECSDIRIRQPKNESFRRYLARQGVAGTIFSTRLKSSILHRPSFSIMQFVAQIKNHICASSRAMLSDQSYMLFSSLFLGNREQSKDALEESTRLFGAWGILHFLARSGLHLVIFISLWITLLRCIPLPFTLKQLILMLLVCLYCVLSWTSTPFVRAFITFILQRVCMLLGLQTNALHLVSVTCCLLLFFSPIQLLFLDFQLSFALTFALCWFNQIMIREQIESYKKVLRDHPSVA